MTMKKKRLSLVFLSSGLIAASVVGLAGMFSTIETSEFSTFRVEISSH
jgi:hypothetical protein